MLKETLRSITLMLAALMMAVCASAAPAAEITVQTDRGMIRMNEAFTLTFSAKGRVDADPDFSPLEQDFEVAGTSQNSSFTIMNGQAESSSNWVVTVFPKHTGTLTVPPISFGSDTSPELQIEVQAGADPGVTENKEVFITVESSPGDPYVQAQSIVTVRLYRVPNMANENLSQLEIEGGDVIVQPLDDGKNYATNLYGRQYNVHERRYAVFPQQPGLVRIKPLQYSGLRVASRRSFFDMDPFGSARGEPVRIQSEAATLNVRPAAATPWLPATRLKIEEKWSGEPTEFRVGEPLTRRLRITATGLTAEQLPELTGAPVDGFKQYPDQPSLDNQKSETGITGVREESVAFMPTRPGTYVLPAVEIKWWNTKTGKEEIARVPERSVTVLPPADGSYVPEVPQQTAPSQQTESGRTENPLAPATGMPAENSVWFWLSLALALGWLLTGLAWWLQRRRHGKLSLNAVDHATADLAQAEKMLEQACRQNRADAVKDALLAWARARWEHAPQSLEAIAARSGDSEALRTQLRTLNARLYAPGASAADWDGTALWQAFNAYRNSVDDGSKGRKTPSLPPLHKI
ncbi:MAG TPA: BatD family protein [Gammaproteobacteria bacterium]|nr:BatD family protein [Gammaproteobacteria bacterium]